MSLNVRRLFFVFKINESTLTVKYICDEKGGGNVCASDAAGEQKPPSCSLDALWSNPGGWRADKHMSAYMLSQQATRDVSSGESPQ